MQLARKVESKTQFKQEEQQYKKALPVDWRLWEIDYSAVIPHGKFKDCIVEDIVTEDWYWKFMMENNLFGSWGLVKLKKSVEQTKQALFHSETDGCYWKEIMVFEYQSEPVPEEWLYE